MAWEIIRPVGHLEKAATARHFLGHYRSVCHSARYLHNEGLTIAKWKYKFIQALSEFVTQHGALCAGVIGEETNHPQFIRLRHLNLNEIVTCHDLVSLTDNDVEEYLSRQHEETWRDLTQRPGWRLNLLGSKGPCREIEVILAFHHAFFDGQSATNFHRMLFKALQTIENGAKETYIEAASAPIPVPSTISLLPPVEKLTPLPTSWSYFFSTFPFVCKQYWGIEIPQFSLWKSKDLQSSEAPIWTGNPPALNSMSDYRCHVQLFTLEPTRSRRLRIVCQQQGCSITGLLHGIMVCALSKMNPVAGGFYGHTPYSMRPWTGTNPTGALSNETSDHCCFYNRQVVQGMLVSGDRQDRQQDLYVKIWQVARNFKADLKSELSKAPLDNELAILPYIADWHSFLKDQVGKPRKLSFEVSNVGTLDNTATEPGPYRILRYLQSQSGYVSGPPLSLSTATMADGPMTVSMSWQGGAVDQRVPETVMAEIEFWLDFMSDA